MTENADSPVFPPRYRLVFYCFLLGILGAASALAFEEAVRLAQSLLLEGLGRYRPPEPGALPRAGYVHVWTMRWWIPLATTVGGALSGILVYSTAPEAEGHGTDAAVDAYHQRGGEVRTRIPFVKGVASALTIGSGGVAGREGPTAQISVGLGSILARLLKVRGQERRIMMLAAMSAGLAAIFRAPLGMAIFAVEILYSGMVFESEALIYTVISAVTAYAIHGFFVGWSPIFSIPAGLSFHDPLSLLGFLLLGVIAGVVGAVLPAVFYGIRDFFRRLPGPPHWKPAAGGLLVGLVGMAFPEMLGTGYGWVELALAGKLSLGLMLVLVVLKAPAMAATIGSGGSGGVFAPTVTIGAVLGGAVGLLLASLFPAMGIVPAAFVLVGMAAVFSSAARTPISTLIMVAEMTGGYGLIVPAMLGNITSFGVQRSLTRRASHPTLYESQLPSREDSPAHRGVFVRRAIDLIERGAVDPSELTLPRLTTLLRLGVPIPFGHGDGLLARLVVEPGSALDGAAISDCFVRFPGATAVTIIRGEETILPRGTTTTAAGDQVIVMTTPAALERLQSAAGALT
jgi:CIC family chloride channel protein